MVLDTEATVRVRKVKLFAYYISCPLIGPRAPEGPRYKKKLWTSSKGEHVKVPSHIIMYSKITSQFGNFMSNEIFSVL